MKLPSAFSQNSLAQGNMTKYEAVWVQIRAEVEFVSVGQASCDLDY